MQQITATSFVRQFSAVILLGLGADLCRRDALGGLLSLSVMETCNLLQRSRSGSGALGGIRFWPGRRCVQHVGALSTIPMGVVYLLFAPFPWQITSLRQSITLPEMVVWWASFPLLVLGLWFSVRYRLRMISPILIFTVMLTFAYSVFQGNVGTAYRQRAQLLVFYFIFVAVGFVLMKEKREERKRLQLEERQGFGAATGGNLQGAAGSPSV